MPDPSRALLIQLPLNSAAALEPSGNTPLAAGILAASAGLPPACILPREILDGGGDRMLLSEIGDRMPGIAAFTLYSWNAERSAWLARNLRAALPGCLFVAGGPEVSADNSWLRNSGAFDLLVSGEGEPVAGEVLDPVRARALASSCGGFLEVPPSSSIPGSGPDPWLSGHLDPAAYGSVALETIRGCASGCLFCSYRRRHPRPRVQPAPEALARCAGLVRKGATELVFLDPTFNSRSDLRTLLTGLSRLRTDCFAEIRGETVDGDLAGRFASAGFRTVEIGLQTSSDPVLSGCSRSAVFSKALEGAGRLSACGVKPVLDLILGLPGDTPAGPIAAAREMAARGFEFDAQIFYLALLPGTEARARADSLGLEWMRRPPYYATRSGRWTLDDLAEARGEISDIFGFDPDFAPRPMVCDGWPGTAELDLDAGEELPPDPLSLRHSRLLLKAEDPWKARQAILRAAGRRMAMDPFCVLDVQIAPGQPFPLDLFESLRSIDEPRDYSGRTARIHGMDGNLRPSVLIADWRRFPADWLAHASSECPVVADADRPEDLPRDLLEAGVGIRLPGESWDLPALAASVPFEDRVFFRSCATEQLWCEGILGL